MYQNRDMSRNIPSPVWRLHKQLKQVWTTASSGNHEKKKGQIIYLGIYKNNWIAKLFGKIPMVLWELHQKHDKQGRRVDTFISEAAKVSLCCALV